MDWTPAQKFKVTISLQIEGQLARTLPEISGAPINVVLVADPGFEAGSVNDNGQLVIFLSPQIVESEVHYSSVSQLKHVLIHELFHFYVTHFMGSDFFQGPLWQELAQLLNWSLPTKSHPTSTSSEFAEARRKKGELIKAGQVDEAFALDRKLARSAGFPSLYAMTHLQEYLTEVLTFLSYETGFRDTLSDSLWQFLIKNKLAGLNAAHEELEDKVPLINGPNCWNSVLYQKGFVSHIRYSSPEEISFWLASPYCEKLEKNQTKKPGDVLTILSHEGHVHSMLRLDDVDVFSKNTSHRLDPYSDIRADLVYSMFRLYDLNCSAEQERCAYWMEIYRCHSHQADLQEFFKAHPAYEKFWSRLERLSKSVQEMTFDAQMSKAKIRHRALVIKAGLIQIKKDLKDFNGNKKGFFWEALYSEIGSLQTQVRILLTP